jgi:predicted transcriptional regulator
LTASSPAVATTRKAKSFAKASASSKSGRKSLAALDAALARGVADGDAGRVRDADEVFDELRKRYQGKPGRSAT